MLFRSDRGATPDGPHPVGHDLGISGVVRRHGGGVAGVEQVLLLPGEHVERLGLERGQRHVSSSCCTADEKARLRPVVTGSTMSSTTAFWLPGFLARPAYLGRARRASALGRRRCLARSAHLKLWLEDHLAMLVVLGSQRFFQQQPRSRPA